MNLGGNKQAPNVVTSPFGRRVSKQAPNLGALLKKNTQQGLNDYIKKYFCDKLETFIFIASTHCLKN